MRIILTVLLLGAASGAAAQQGGAPLIRINRAYLDTTCSPCKDFFRFANGAWLDSVRIPPEQDATGALDALRVQNNILVGGLLDSLAYAPARHARTTLERSVGEFFRSCMDTTLSPAAELAPLQPELARLAAIRTPADLGSAIGRLQRSGLTPFFWLVVINDDFEPDRMIAELRGLTPWGMPSRRAYVAPDSASVRMRAAYVAMLTRVFAALGDPAEAAAANALRVLALEAALYRTDPRDDGPVNNQHDLAELGRMAPGFDWRSFAAGLGRPDLPALNLRPPGILHAIDSLATAVPLVAWRAYLRWTLVVGYSRGAKAFGGAINAFYRMAQGRSADPPRKAVCANVTTNYLDRSVAAAYVARGFSPEDRAAALAMTEGMRSVLRERLRSLEWLSPATRSRALAKLDSMRLWIGYPDRWEDGSEPLIGPGPFAAAFITARRHRADRRLAQVGRRVQRSSWEGNPAFVDPSYYASSNGLSIEAAALQRPFFDARAEADSYARIGFTIGHELTHGFDSRGRLHNEVGKREDWWAPEDAREYERRAELVVRQYSQYVVIDSVRLNGRQTLAENIADIGGLTLAYLAFKRATERAPAEPVDGYTQEQRFFIAFAQTIFRTASRPARLRLQAENDDHAVSRWRVNGALANLAAFAAAFGCKEGDPMYLAVALRGNIW